MKTYTFKTSWGLTRKVKACSAEDAWEEMIEDFGDGAGDWELITKH